MDMGFLEPAIPACIGFGPIFMAFGAVTSPEQKTRRGLFLFGGAIMVTLGLAAGFHGIADLRRSIEQLQALPPRK